MILNKISKRNIIIVLALLTIVSCTKADYKVKVNYINKTGEEIRELKIGEKRIGKLKNEKETGYIPLKEFHFDSGLPDEPIKGEINHESTIDYSDFYWCGTEKYTVNEGTYDIEIHKSEIDNKTYLRLQLK